MEHCKWYVSPSAPECGELAVGTITHVPLRNGRIKKLDKPMSVCGFHKAESDRRFAEIRSHS